MVALGLALGIAPGTVPAFIGGVSLITVGRRVELRTSASLVLLALALGIGALRWSTVDLQQLFGIQEVLGPSLLVGPELPAAATGLAAFASIAALMVWCSPPLEPLVLLPGEMGVWSTRVWAWLETWAPAAGIASVFFRPAQPGLAPLSPLALAVVALGAGLLLRRAKPVYSWAVLAAALTSMVVASALLVETV